MVMFNEGFVRDYLQQLSLFKPDTKLIEQSKRLAEIFRQHRERFGVVAVIPPGEYKPDPNVKITFKPYAS